MVFDIIEDSMEFINFNQNLFIMKRILMLILTCILCLIAVILLFFVGVIIYGSVTSFHPDRIDKLEVDNNQSAKPDTASIISMMTWNVGYAGLGKEMDFFYENGEMVRPKKEQFDKYLDGIIKFVKNRDSMDIFLFQEIDFSSKRSYETNEYDLLKQQLPVHSSLKAINYKSGFVPVPFFEPMGKVNSGLATYAKFYLSEAIRIATPGSHAWPKRLFMLKRCFIVNRFPIINGKDLVVINVNNSAYSDEKELREAELELLHEYLIKEYNAGNYVVAGGDWNQNPPGMEVTKIGKYISHEVWPMDQNFLPVKWDLGLRSFLTHESGCGSSF